MGLSLNRRRFLQGLGASVALPLLPSTGWAQQSSFPRRIVFFYSANGTVPSRWSPSGTENDWELGEVLQPLQPHKEDLIVIEGVDMRVTTKGPGAAHQRGMGAILTGRPLNDGDFSGGGGAISGWASGISVDQEIANQTSQQTPFHSLQLGVRATGGANRQTMVYGGSDMPILPDNDPYNVFDRLFADFDADPFDLERTRLQRRSVLDFVLEDLNKVNQKVGAADRARLEAHLDSVRRIEERLQSTEGVASCEAPMMGQRIDINADDNVPELGQLQMDLLVNAMACDLTRVGTIQFSRATSSQRYSWLGFDDRHHDLSHEGDNNDAAMDKLVQINQWIAGQFGYLIGKMKEIPEGDGTMLDHSVVVWVNSLGKGNSHTRNDVPIVMAGGLHDSWQTNRYLDFDDQPHNDLLISLARGMEVDIDTFGDPDFASGPLPGL